ncbi:MAG: PHP domain-containing protein [Proteobacteria bacterium]|nr:PHP domain-containing protein [Desulfobulbaceae bacterium]MBU4152030.1 PHP domain-containing protein [Pseudomonadota bacterium]MDP2106870.1 PHP domain-containing protein [Desulfobulbaceae bacterium]
MPGQISRNAFSIPAGELVHGVPAWECHVHTLFTDGEASVLDCVERALDQGLSRIIFTEHTEPWKAKRKGWFTQYADEVRMAAQRYIGEIEVILGVEAPANDFVGGLEFTTEMLDTCDFILGTAHRYPGLDGRRVRDLSAKECIELEYATLLALSNNEIIDAIAHIGGTCGLYCIDFPEELAVDVIRAAALNGVAIELNSRYHSSLDRLIRICVQENARVTIGSDAHSLGEIGTAFRGLQAIFEAETV